MDNAVALVQTYLRVNGYLTVTEYPVVEALEGGGFQSATDLDILAFRFGRASMLGGAVTASGQPIADRPMLIDPALDLRPDLPDMIIGEVKEGRAFLNRGATDRAVLASAMNRFGCCDADESESVVDDLLQRGKAKIARGHRVRLVAFGSLPPETPTKQYEVILLGHILDFLTAHLRRHWSVIQAADTKDPALGFLKLLEKAGRGIRFDGGKPKPER
ncbi:MAG: hypothetical protein JNK53_08910 [Phycisphaerae bacterium]|nr:hypothetical protein [Phycisphaerae bacterium]